MFVQKHRQTKGNFMPKLMFVDGNVLWKKYTFLGQVLTDFLCQAVNSVQWPIWSTVLMGCYTEKF